MELSKLTLLRAILYCDNSEEKLAAFIQVPTEAIHQWLTTPETMTYAHAAHIEEITHNTVSRFDLMPQARWLKKYITYHHIGKKIMAGFNYESRRVQKEHNTIKYYPWIAKTVGFKHEEEYRQAKYVIKYGLFALLKAMDLEKISIQTAYQIALLPVPLQEQYIQLTPEKMQRKLTYAPIKCNILRTCEQILTDRPLILAEEKSRKPIRIAFLTLILLKNEFLFFRERIDELFQKQLNVSLSELLPILTDLNWLIEQKKGQLKFNDLIL